MGPMRLLNGLAMLVTLALASCRFAPTEVLVVIDSDAPPSRVLTLRATVRTGTAIDGPGELRSWTHGAGSAGIALPASFAIIPGASGRDARISLVIDAELAPGAPGEAALRFRRIAFFSLSPSVTHVLRVFLSVECGAPAVGCVTAGTCTVGTLCEEQGRTCGDQGACVGREATLLPGDAGLVFDAGRRDVPAPPPDVQDVAVDAIVDTGVDVACPAGQTRCGAVCVDLASDLAHCGSCTNACATAPNGAVQCNAGVCTTVCNAGYNDCDAVTANGCEANCGAGRACAAGSCAGGWLPISTSPLSPRFDTAFAIAPERQELIIWGGGGCGSACSDGARYSWNTDSWVPMATGPLSARESLGVWTGGVFVVWGGNRVGTFLGDGAVYDPVTDRWTSMATLGALTPRADFHAVWTGTEVLYFGGRGATGIMTDGALYNPATDSWRAVPSHANTVLAAGTWTGTELVLFGGTGATTCAPGNATSATRRYLPGGAWTDVGAGPLVPSARFMAPNLSSCAPQPWSAPWTGSEMWVWGGFDGTAYRSTGGLYHPATSTWRSTAPPPSPISAGAYSYACVWTGQRVLCWSPVIGTSATNALFAYDPGTDTWTTIVSRSNPTPTTEGSAFAWTGRELIVWGGRGDLTSAAPQGDGGRFAL